MVNNDLGINNGPGVDNNPGADDEPAPDEPVASAAATAIGAAARQPGFWAGSGRFLGSLGPTAWNGIRAGATAVLGGITAGGAAALSGIIALVIPRPAGDASDMIVNNDAKGP